MSGERAALELDPLAVRSGRRERERSARIWTRRVVDAYLRQLGDVEVTGQLPEVMVPARGEDRVVVLASAQAGLRFKDEITEMREELEKAAEK